MFFLDNINDELHAVTENLQMMLDVRSKLQHNVVVLIAPGIEVDRSIRNTQLTDVVNTVFLMSNLPRIGMTAPISLTMGLL